MLIKSIKYSCKLKIYNFASKHSSEPKEVDTNIPLQILLLLLTLSLSIVLLLCCVYYIILVTHNYTKREYQGKVNKYTRLDVYNSKMLKKTSRRAYRQC